MKWTWSRVMKITPVQAPHRLLGLGYLGLEFENGLRDLLKPPERGFELSELGGGGPVERRRFRRQPDIDGLALDLVGEFKIGAVALVGIGATGAIGLATLGHSLQHGSLAEVLQLIQAAFELLKTLGMFG